MVSPTALGGLGLGANVGGTILSVLGVKQSGAAQKDMFNYQAGVAEAAKTIALQNRDYAITSGETEAGMYGLKARNVAGRIRATQGASGIDVGGGSSLDVQRGQQFVTGLDMNQIRANAARKAYGYAVEAAGDEAQAGAYRSAASNVEKATRLNVASSILSGVSSVSSKWLQGQQYGLWGSDRKPQQGGMYWGDPTKPGFGPMKGEDW